MEITYTISDEDVKAIEHKIGAGNFAKYFQETNDASIKAKANSGRKQILEDAKAYYIESGTVPTKLDDSTVISDYTKKAEYETRAAKNERVYQEEKALRDSE